MNIDKMLSQFTTDELQKLAAAQSAEELAILTEGMGHPIKGKEAEAVFAMLYPVRGKEPLDEEDLTIISGGTRPQPTMPPRFKFRRGNF